METINNNSVNWVDFITATLLLIAFWFILNFLNRVLKKGDFLGNYQQSSASLVRNLLLIFEPLAIAVLVSIFILINPLFHGIIIGGIFIAGFLQVQNYLNGLVVRVDKSISINKEISVGNLAGIIYKIERLGLQLKTDQGLHFISYSSMLKEGYLLVSSEEIGGIYHLKIKPKTENDKAFSISHFMNLLLTSPYLDWNHKPELLPSGNEEGQILVRILVKEESHLHQLISLIKDWGYVCSIIN